jgi:hypothetical protein
MSLVVCSNNKDETNLYDRNSLDQAPYRFRNHLTNPVILPPNSEVAVQSVKINKDSLIQTSPSDIWFQYFGERLDTSADPNKVDRSTSNPIMCSLLDLNRETKPLYLNLTDYIQRLTDGMRRGMPHPDIDMTTTDGVASGTFAEVVRTGGHSSAEFNNIRMNFAMLSSAGNGVYDPDSPGDIGLASTDWKFLTDAYSQARTMSVVLDAGDNNKMKVSCTADSIAGGGNNNVCWLNRNPVSHLGGVFEIDLTGLHSGGANAESINIPFAIGLSRGTGNEFGQVAYLDRTAGDLSKNPHFYDFVVYGEQIRAGGEFFLRVGHSVLNPLEDTRETARPISMEEIIYYDNNDGSAFSGLTPWRAGDVVQAGTEGYNLSRNWAKFDRLRFIIDGEEVRVEMESSQGGANGAVVADTPVILTSYTEATENLSGQPINYPKPAGQTCWNLYPKVMIAGNGRSITIDKYDGRAMTYQGTSTDADSVDSSWYVRMVKEGDIRLCMELDTRYMYLMTDADNDYRPVPADDSDAFMENYHYVVILGNGEPHYTDTSRANLQARLGHSRAVLTGTTGATQVYNSDLIPNLMDRSSLFIRLDNFTQTTFNSGTGRPSKILYQVPRFDSSNRETGLALYYEPHQRTYIKLNNTDEIALNEIHLSLCDNLERLADRGITGKTIVCLHFKQSDTPLLKTKF